MKIIKILINALICSHRIKKWMFYYNISWTLFLDSFCLWIICYRCCRILRFLQRWISSLPLLWFTFWLGRAALVRFSVCRFPLCVLCLDRWRRLPVRMWEVMSQIWCWSCTIFLLCHVTTFICTSDGFFVDWWIWKWFVLVFYYWILIKCTLRSFTWNFVYAALFTSFLRRYFVISTRFLWWNSIHCCISPTCPWPYIFLISIHLFYRTFWTTSSILLLCFIIWFVRCTLSCFSALSPWMRGIWRSFGVFVGLHHTLLLYFLTFLTILLDLTWIRIITFVFHKCNLLLTLIHWNIWHLNDWDWHLNIKL